MLSYFSPLLPGELLHSAIARTAWLCGFNTPYAMPLMALGARSRYFGVRLPRHLQALLDNLPQFSGYNADTLLVHSLFPAVAPFLDTAKRACLRCSILGNGTVPAFNPAVRELPFCLRYCPFCAARDQRRSKAVYWYIAPQHPGVTACREHKVRFVASGASIGAQRRLLYAPDWINLKAPTVSATPMELVLTEDLEWLLETNTLMPGRTKLQMALRHLLLESKTYRRRNDAISGTALVRDMRDLFGDDVLEAVGCGLREEGCAPWPNRVLRLSSGHEVREFQRYALIARTAGKSLCELFSLAKSVTARRRAASLPAKMLSKVAHAKEVVQRAVRELPGASRLRIGLRCGKAYTIVRRCAPQWFEATLPEWKRPTQVKRRCKIDWKQRDQDWSASLGLARQRLVELQAGSRGRRILRRMLVDEARLPNLLRPSTTENLPLTLRALHANCDTPASFVERRVAWAIGHFSRDGAVLGLKYFIHQADICRDCSRCKVAASIAAQAWKRYRALIGHPVMR